jgi:hypothetical protein
MREESIGGKVEYEKSLPAFKALVSSYFFFAPLVGY